MTANASTSLENTSFQARTGLVLVCVSFLVAILLPGALKGHRTGQWLIFIFGCSALLIAWFFQIFSREVNNKWRQLIVVVDLVLLTASIPTFYFEFSPAKWFLRSHDWPSLYVRPWVHLGFMPIFFGVACSFFGKGRTRVAMVTGSSLLAILWASMSVWIF